MPAPSVATTSRTRAQDETPLGRSPRSPPRADCTSASSSRPAAAARDAAGQGPVPGIPGWYRWAGVAAAAAVVVAIAIALPNVGGGESGLNAPEDSQGTMAAGEQAEDAVSGGQVELQDENYDATELEQLARAAGAGQAAQSAEADAPRQRGPIPRPPGACVGRSTSNRQAR